jgi:hypothetical protein
MLLQQKAACYCSRRLRALAAEGCVLLQQKAACRYSRNTLTRLQERRRFSARAVLQSHTEHGDASTCVTSLKWWHAHTLATHSSHLHISLSRPPHFIATPRSFGRSSSPPSQTTTPSLCPATAAGEHHHASAVHRRTSRAAPSHLRISSPL